MTLVDLQQAEHRLDDLLRRWEQGEDVVIARGGRPAARLVPVDDSPRRVGMMRLDVPEDFDEPLDEGDPTSWG